MEGSDEPAEETVLLEEVGQKISFVQAYVHRGRLLEGLCLYDYMSIVMLKRRREGVTVRGEVEFDSSWSFSKTWVQVLRRPGKHAIVCFDGYLGMNFDEDDDERYYRRYVMSAAQLA
ncbi:hypothetical protein DM02DRAFT_310095 [Periconia macrospinosa]|uniref:Uncharacterized protein n=1 Tax=Periconia macrospinosa TaxID=97972 RepID=A0A2V1D1J6_9PLEO|nr:hypothetical protein DM02DRAFT_310095 [Periconia macrospinosa]